MTDCAKEILLELSKHPNAKGGAELRYSTDPKEKSKAIHAVDELVRLGYVEKIGSALGFAILVITPAGDVASQQL